MKKLLLAAVLLIAGYQLIQLKGVAPDLPPAPTATRSPERNPEPTTTPTRHDRNPDTVVDGADALARAFAERRSNLSIQAQGIVEKTLPDDNKGSRHQRFIVRVGDRQTVLIAHNIDLAPPVAALRVGDRIEFRGEYEWSSKGGVIHWTHRDPQGRHAGGWLRHNGRDYQ